MTSIFRLIQVFKPTMVLLGMKINNPFRIVMRVWQVLTYLVVSNMCLTFMFVAVITKDKDYKPIKWCLKFILDCYSSTYTKLYRLLRGRMRRGLFGQKCVIFGQSICFPFGLNTVGKSVSSRQMKLVTQANYEYQRWRHKLAFNIC